MIARRTLALVAAVTWVIPTPGMAQDFDEFDDLDEGWISILYPKALFTTRNDVSVGGFGTYILPNRFEYLGPASYRAAVAGDIQVSTTGSWFAKGRLSIPNEVPGWRFHATLEAEREARENYFGFGNGTEFDGDNRNGQPHFYHAVHMRLSLRGEVQRTITGPLRLMMGFDASRWRFQALEGPSVFAQDVAAGADIPDGFSNDLSGRLGLVVDTRNNEIAPEKGLLLLASAGGANSGLGDESYGRFTFNGAAYARLSDKWFLAGRVLGQTMTGSPRIGAMYVMDGVERVITGLGGAGTHRAVFDNRFVDADHFLVNLENRFVVVNIAGIARLTTVWFLDVGRVFPQGGFQLTTDALKVGGGTGLMMQIGQWGVIGGTVGVGPDGAVVNSHTRWSF